VISWFSIRVAPARPGQLRLAALRAAADELRERIAALREHAAARGEARVEFLSMNMPSVVNTFA
jgi:hydroxypyruvate isomerase